MKFVVTGGAGFIGSHLAEALVEKGEVVVVDNFSFGSEWNVSDIRDKITLVDADISDKEKMREALQGADIVFHHAALRAVAPSVKDPKAYYENNVLGSRALFEVAVEVGVKKIIFASSTSIYGDKVSFPTKETDVTDPLSPYAETKLQTEKDLQELGKKHNIPYVIFRYFTVFGTRQNPKSKYAMLISIFINKLLNKERPTVYGDGEQSRDFTYVKNVVQANLLAIDTNKADNHIINIANGGTTSVNELFEKLSAIIGVNVEALHGDGQPGESRKTFADISLAKELLGYNPKYSMEEGLRETVSYYQEIKKIEKNGAN
jgi:UDP-glucose 4-epimerase